MSAADDSPDETGRPSTYTRLSLLGEGGSGRVELAVDSRSGARVALKRFRPDMSAIAAREALLLAGLEHPGIVRLLDAFHDPDGDAFVLVYEYVAGEDLFTATRGRPLDEVVLRFADAARALAFVHRRGLLHRDLKPENMQVARRGAGDHTVLLDFGLASAARERAPAAGTLRYLAPEVLDGAAATERTDLYSLGIVLYRLLAGELPGRDRTAVEVIRLYQGADLELPRPAAMELPAALDELVRSLLRRDPSRRPGSADEVIEVLERAFAGVAAAGRLEELPARARSLALADTTEFESRIVEDVAVPRAVIALALPEGSDEVVLRLRVGLAQHRVPVDLASNHAGDAGGASQSLDVAVESRLFVDCRDPGTEPAVGDAILRALAARGGVVILDDAAVPSASLRGLAKPVSLPRPSETEVRDAIQRGLGVALPQSLLPALRAVKDFTPRTVREGLIQLIERGVLHGVEGRIAVDDSGSLAVPPATGGGGTTRTAARWRREAVRLLRERSEREVEWVRTLATSPIAVAPTSIAAVDSRNGGLAGPEASAALERLRDDGLVVSDPDGRVSLASHALALAVQGEQGTQGAPTTTNGLADEAPDARASRCRTLAAAILAEGDADPLRRGVAGLLLAASGDDSTAGPTLLDAGIALRVAGRAKEARRFLEAARGLAISGARGGFRARALRWLADCASFEGDAAGAVALAEDALAAADCEADDRARCFAVVARSELRFGKSDASVRAIESGLGVTGASPATIAVLHSTRSLLLRRQGRTAEAVLASRLAVAAAADLLSPELAAAWMELANALADEADVDAAAAAYERAREIGAAIGRSEVAALAASNLGRLFFLHGRTGEAASRFATAVDGFEAAAVPAQAENALVMWLYALNALGDLDGARAVLLRGRRVFGRGSAMQSRAMFLRHGAETELRAGNVDAADRMLRESVDLRRRCGPSTFVCDGEAVLARSLSWRGARREARERLAAALRESRTAADRASNGASGRREAPRSIETLLALAEHHAWFGVPARAERAAQHLLAITDGSLPRRLLPVVRLVLAVASWRKCDAGACALHAEAGLTAVKEVASDGTRALLLALRTRASASGLEAIESGFDAALLHCRADGLALERGVVLLLRGEARYALGCTMSGARSANDVRGASDLLAGARADADRGRELLGRLGFSVDGHAAAGWIPGLAALEVKAAGGEGFQGLDRRITGMERLLGINKAINAELDPTRLLNLILDSAIDLCGARRGFLVLVKGIQVEVRVARNFSQQDVLHPEFEISHSVARGVARTGEPILTSNALSDNRLRSIASIHELRVLSILCVPLRSRNEVLGSIYLDHPDVVDRFDVGDLEILIEFAWAAGIALERARLYQENLDRTTELLRAKQENERLNAELRRQVAQQERELIEVKDVIDAERRVQALRYDYRNIISRSRKMQDVLRLIDRITETDFPVLIQGESGTGKELVARAIHHNGKRAAKNFVAVNCAAMAETLIEAELFGYVKGAFTGADRDRKGLFEIAHDGTLFLDEIGDMSLEVQKRLLRVIQSGEFYRLGAKEPIKVDVRIICATHRDLKAMIQAGLYRDDLYYRIGVAQVDLPPLREREGDVRLLIDHLMRELKNAGQAPPRRFSEEALRILERYPWPGNVRELQNEVKRLLFLRTDHPLVDVSDLSPIMVRQSTLPISEDAGGSLKEQLLACERAIVEETLRSADRNKAETARRLGISIRGLYKILERIRDGASGSNGGAMVHSRNPKDEPRLPPPAR